MRQIGPGFSGVADHIDSLNTELSEARARITELEADAAAASTDRYDWLTAERDAAIARAEAAEAQVAALTAKVDALCSKGQCGCSWDREGDVCEYHSPKILAAEAQVAKLREAAAPFVAHYEPWMDEHPENSRCWTYPIMSMGDVRKLRAALEPSDG